MLYLSPQKNESIHSYLIRMLMVNSCMDSLSDIKGIVSISGVIRAIPNLDLQRGVLFEKAPDELFDLLLRNHLSVLFLTKKSEELLEDFIFFGLGDIESLVHVNQRTQLRFCPMCFKEQIYEKGFCWFKLCWQHDVECYKHRRGLFEVRCSVTGCCGKSVNIIDNLRTVMTGICISCTARVWERGFYRELSPSYTLDDKYYFLISHTVRLNLVL